MSLLEVVIAMLLFAVLALAILPLALQATTLSAGNRDAVSANAFASGQLAAARSAFPDGGENSCAALRAKSTTGVADSAGTGLVADVIVADCPNAYPAAITVRVVVTDSDSSSSATTRMATKVVVTGP